MYFLSGSFKSFYFRKVSLEVFAEPARVEGDKEVRAAEVGWERRNYGSVMREWDERREDERADSGLVDESLTMGMVITKPAKILKNSKTFDCIQISRQESRTEEENNKNRIEKPKVVHIGLSDKDLDPEPLHFVPKGYLLMTCNDHNHLIKFICLYRCCCNISLPGGWKNTLKRMNI